MENYQIFGLIISLFILGFIINYIRKGKLKEKYALLWILSGFTLIIFSIWFRGIEFLAKLFGVHSPINFFFMLGGIYVIFIVLHLSFALSKSHNDFKALAQRIALLEEKYGKYIQNNETRKL